jgi:hypothetical protein
MQVAFSRKPGVKNRGKKYYVLGKGNVRYAVIMAKDIEEARKNAKEFFGPLIKIKVTSSAS